MYTAGSRKMVVGWQESCWAGWLIGLYDGSMAGWLTAGMAD